MHDNRYPRRVENYTNAFLGCVAVILFMGFWVIGALFGFLWVILSAMVIDLCIRRFKR